jgi:formylglycine-generating enzyme required for sulfatase activity
MAFFAGEGKMKNNLRFITGLLALILALLLVACNLKSGQPTTEPATTIPTGEPITPTDETVGEEPVVLAEPEAGTLMLWTDSSYVVYVPAGEFIMGRDETTVSDHAPAHSITLGGFWIHQAEVTNAMYALCVNLGICTPPTHETSEPNWYTDPEYANAPVVGVDWNQAGTYCEWVDARLPTEAEWEKAARGTDGATYPWGEDEPACSLLNFEDCLALPAPEIIRTYPMGASPYKLADMAGNVFEWVSDRYADDYYSSSPSSNPTGPVTGEERVVRGSSYLTPTNELDIPLRNFLDPAQESADLGFRCVLTGEAIDDTPTTPACTTLGFDLIVSAHQWPVQVPVPPPALALEFYCILDGQNNQYGTASIWLDQSVDPGTVLISSPNGNLTCNQDAIDLQKFNCGGPALKPGQPATISVCNIPPMQALVQPTCPVFYHFNTTTNKCQYGIPNPVICLAPDVVIFGYGCLPAPQNGECPVGSYSAEYDNKPVCVPAGGPECQGQLCPAACPAGLVFNEGDFCCDYPTDVEPICPPGFTYDETWKFCLPDAPIQAGCTNITSTVPTCAPPPVVCSSITTDGACVSNPACQWHPYLTTVGGYCTNK